MRTAGPSVGVVFSKRNDYQRFRNAKTALSRRKSSVLSLIAQRLTEKQNAQQLDV
jgi:DNA-binding CsgD family transcriptional regulator